MTLGEAASALGATVVGPDVRFTSVATDSRTIEAGALFIALRGERFDGHEYLGAARESGAAAAMVERVAGVSAQAVGMPLLMVGDAKLALGALARHWRQRFRIPVVGIVGSNGKTTVKEMLAGVLREHFGPDRVAATIGNLNNEIGLPLTVLRLREGHRAAVLEIGMNHPGETGYLAGLAHPTIALVNNAQREHQEFMGSVAEVAAEHGALVRALPADGIAVLNRDDAHFDYWREIAGQRAVRDFGTSAAAGVGASYQLVPIVLERPVWSQRLARWLLAALEDVNADLLPARSGRVLPGGVASRRAPANASSALGAAARLGGPWRQRCGYSQHPRRKQAFPGDTGVLLHLQLGAPVASPLDRTAPARQQGWLLSRWPLARPGRGTGPSRRTW
jgi:hypothetical protein